MCGNDNAFIGQCRYYVKINLGRGIDTKIQLRCPNCCDNLVATIPPYGKHDGVIGPPGRTQHLARGGNLANDKCWTAVRPNGANRAVCCKTYRTAVRRPKKGTI